MLYRVFGHWEKSYLNTRKNTIFLRVKISFVVKRIATDVLLFFMNFVYIINRKIHGCLEILDLFLVLNMISHSWDIMFKTRNKSGISAHPCLILYIINDPILDTSMWSLSFQENEIEPAMQAKENIGRQQGEIAIRTWFYHYIILCRRNRYYSNSCWINVKI